MVWGAGQIDFPAMIRAAQAIAEEIAMDSLLDRVIRIIVESAGAQRAVLLLDRGGGLAVEAFMTIDPDRVHTGSQAAAAVGWELPESVVEEVRRTRRPVVLGGSEGYDRFSKDPYLMERRPRSLLCVAMVHRGRLSGVLVLENRVAPGAFSPARVDVASFLSSQAAIALENAMLAASTQRMSEFMKQANDRLEREVEARTAELEQRLLNNGLPEEKRPAAREGSFTTPILPVDDDTILMPIIGAIDNQRSQQIVDAAVAGLGSCGARLLIVDITGAGALDDGSAAALLNVARGIRLLGAEVVITGVGPSAARLLLGAAVETSDFITKATLRDGLEYALDRWD